MTAIDRTAYPLLSTRLTREELDARYTLTEADLVFIRANARGESRRLLLAVLLKIRRMPLFSGARRNSLRYRRACGGAA